MPNADDILKIQVKNVKINCEYSVKYAYQKS